MTQAVQDVVFAAWFEYPAAGPRAVWRAAKRECERLGLPVPKYHSVWRYLDRRPRPEKLLRAGTLETPQKEHGAVVRFQMAARANERFQFDNKHLRVWGKTVRDGVVVPTPIWITAALDECSRAHYPNCKGKIERRFLLLDTGCLRLLPGHRGTGGVSEEAATKRPAALLRVHEIRDELERWIIEDYLVRKHRTLGCTPLERWEATIGVPLVPEDEDALNLLLLHSEERTVQNVGVEFRSYVYWAPPLAALVKTKVRLRYDPDDEASVLVYDATSDAFVCEAHVMGRPASLYAVGDVQRAAREAHAGLLARTKERMDRAARLGRTREAARAGQEVAAALRRGHPRGAAPVAPAPTPARAAADAVRARLEAAVAGDPAGDKRGPADAGQAGSPQAHARPLTADEVYRRLRALGGDRDAA